MNMQDPALALVAICGFSVICVTFIAIIGLMVLRFTGRSIGGMIGGDGLYGLVDSVSGANDPEDSPLQARRTRRGSASDLRARAKSLDFNEAVMRYKEQRPGAPTPAPGSPFPPPQPQAQADETPPPDARSRRNRRRRRGEDDSDADDMFGAFLDEIDPF